MKGPVTQFIEKKHIFISQSSEALWENRHTGFPNPTASAAWLILQVDHSSKDSWRLGTIAHPSFPHVNIDLMIGFLYKVSLLAKARPF